MAKPKSSAEQFLLELLNVNVVLHEVEEDAGSFNAVNQSHADDDVVF